jgi:hypothetical protein
MSIVRFVDTKSKQAVSPEHVKERLNKGVQAPAPATPSVPDVIQNWNDAGNAVKPAQGKVRVRITPQLPKGIEVQHNFDKAGRVLALQPTTSKGRSKHVYQFNGVWLDAKSWGQVLDLHLVTIHARNRENRSIVNSKNPREVELFNSYVINNGLNAKLIETTLAIPMQKQEKVLEKENFIQKAEELLTRYRENTSSPATTPETSPAPFSQWFSEASSLSELLASEPVVEPQPLPVSESSPIPVKQSKLSHVLSQKHVTITLTQEDARNLMTCIQQLHDDVEDVYKRLGQLLVALPDVEGEN